MSKLVRRPSPALVVACLALAVALGGTGYATILQVPRGAVGPLQLKRNAVTAAKLAPNAVRTGHVLNGSLLVEDFRPGQIPQGPKGDRGERGARGPAGISGYEIVRASGTVPANTTLSSVGARCPTGKRVLGGTMSVQGLGAGVFLHGGLFQTEIFQVHAVNTTNLPKQVNSIAICGTVES